MSEEHLLGYTNNHIEKRKGQVRNWSELKSYIPQEVKPEHLDFLRTYFRVQLRIALGRKEKAKEMIEGLLKREGFREFEERNEPLFAAIDMVVRGETGRANYLKQEKPAFKVNY